MKTNDSKELKDEDIVQLGSKDGIFTHDSVWPIFELDIKDKKGIWNRLQTELQIMEYQNYLQDTNPEEIDEFLYINSDIEFELNFYDEIMDDYYFFKFNDKIYCYITGKKSKNKIYARFFFDLEEIIMR